MIQRKLLQPNTENIVRKWEICDGKNKTVLDKLVCRRNDGMVPSLTPVQSVHEEERVPTDQRSI